MESRTMMNEARTVHLSVPEYAVIEGLPQIWKRLKGNKRYMPQKNSVAYALLITLYKNVKKLLNNLNIQICGRPSITAYSDTERCTVLASFIIVLLSIASSTSPTMAGPRTDLLAKICGDTVVQDEPKYLRSYTKVLQSIQEFMPNNKFVTGKDGEKPNQIYVLAHCMDYLSCDDCDVLLQDQFQIGRLLPVQAVFFSMVASGGSTITVSSKKPLQPCRSNRRWRREREEEEDRVVRV
ncbi:Crossover junction endonuclease mus81 [Sarracenia purpurea var. burkii]